MNSVTAHRERVFVREKNGQTPVAYPNACPKTILLPLNHHAGLWGFREAYFLLLHPLCFLLYKACYVLSYCFYYILVMMGNTFRNSLGEKKTKAHSKLLEDGLKNTHTHWVALFPGDLNSLNKWFTCIILPSYHDSVYYHVALSFNDQIAFNITVYSLACIQNPTVTHSQGLQFESFG